MIPVQTFAGRTVGIFGLARSGLSSAHALTAGRARVLAWDDQEKSRAAASAAGIALSPWQDWPWGEVAAVILAPGVPLTHPVPHPIVLMAKEAGAEVIGDVELLFRTLRPEGRRNGLKIVAITGTNGKSTTTALIGHVLAAGGFDAQVGGNIGKPALDLAPPGSRTVYVLEVSSYQIDLTPSLAPDVACLTNITPDHLDRHGGMEGYVAAKARIFARQRAGDVAIAGIDDRYAEGIAAAASSAGTTVVPVAVGRVLGRGVYAVANILYDAAAGQPAAVVDLATAPALPGSHNAQNAGIAYAAARALGMDAATIAAAIQRFPGLAHRMELVGQKGAARFVNDSKATNADAAARALVCYDHIHWIAGGVAKEGGIATLAPLFPRIARAYLIGQAAADFAATLEGRVPFVMAGDLETATRMASADAAASAAAAPVVLLSPACASFDQFRDFEDRGEQFRRIVRALGAPAAAAAGGGAS